MAVMEINSAEPGNTEDYGRLVSCAVRVPGLTLETFLAQARGVERFVWQTQGRALAGMGVVAELTAWGADRFHDIERKAALLFQRWIGDGKANPLATPRLFGGFAFQENFIPDNTWSIYAPASFILPHYQFAQEGEDAPWLILNVTLPIDDDPESALPGLYEALAKRARLLQEIPQAESSGPSAPPTQFNYPMPFPVWEEAIERATGLINAGKLAKVVLARAFEIRFAERVDVESALRFLSEHYAECYRFLFEPRAYHAFYGATPELLVRVQGRQLTTMGLAGSIRRGKQPEEDFALAQALLNDPKERLEHQLVVDALREKLTPLTRRLSVPATPQILRLGNIQHLHTPISGTLREACGVLPLVELLHPTPALGGTPRDTAIRLIREIEPIPRGWYAAPIGWIDPNLDGEFGVAIRSAVSEERRVWLYAGAGIVGSSQPQREWDETTLKFRPMLSALGIVDEKGVV